MLDNLHVIAFGKDDIGNVLGKLSNVEIDRLAFGAVQLDAAGTILKYNAAEAGITGRSAATVIGRNFSPMSRRAPTHRTSRACSMPA